ncbi:hypothetical protein C8R43DRAFT_1238713 [Mycena crocata]|nr:hypothetical protein C8R43DRAFT_1238713 [Mycena crocata]
MLSTLSLVSLSSKSLVGLFGSMFVGAQVTFTVVLSGLSVPKTSLRATPTTRETALLPTKCVLSSGSALFPRVCITIGFAVVLASLFCVLHAKGFTSPSPTQKQNGVAIQPPSPPPEPGSSSSVVKAPRRFRWMLFLMIALLVLLIIAASVAACVYFAHSVPATIQELASFCGDKLSATETRFWNGFFEAVSIAVTYAAALKAGICALGMEDFKIFWITLAAHSSFIVAFTKLRRLRWHLARIAQAKFMPVAICALLVPIIAIASVPQFRWIVWMRWYYRFCLAGLVPSVGKINWHILCFSSYLSSLASTHLLETTILTIAVIHGSAAWVDFTLHFLSSLPFIFRILFERFSRRGAFRAFMWGSVAFFILFYLDAVFSVLVAHYGFLPPRAKQVVRKALYCQESRQQVWEFVWFYVGCYKTWKAEQMDDFLDLAAATPNTLWTKLNSCFEILCDLHPSHTLLIAGPALAFYSYFYVFSNSSPLCAVHSDDLLQDGDNDGAYPSLSFLSFSFPPEPSVENRFAATDDGIDKPVRAEKATSTASTAI